MHPCIQWLAERNATRYLKVYRMYTLYLLLTNPQSYTINKIGKHMKCSDTFSLLVSFYSFPPPFRGFQVRRCICFRLARLVFIPFPLASSIGWKFGVFFSQIDTDRYMIYVQMFNFANSAAVWQILGGAERGHRKMPAMWAGHNRNRKNWDRFTWWPKDGYHLLGRGVISMSLNRQEHYHHVASFCINLQGKVAKRRAIKEVRFAL